MYLTYKDLLITKKNQKLKSLLNLNNLQQLNKEIYNYNKPLRILMKMITLSNQLIELIYYLLRMVNLVYVFRTVNKINKQVSN